ncbi:MAG: cytidylyltransferase domain-containing protein [bacterium]
MIRAFIQARMSSNRFPGKVLAPFHGLPIIAHVFERVSKVITPDLITVVTSTEKSDDPLAFYLQMMNISVFRGPLENVFMRFRQCLEHNPCDWILRLSADSPLLNVETLQQVINRAEGNDCDLITTIFPRTFPKGQNAELIRAKTLIRIDVSELSEDEQEHVTPYFYSHADRFRIVNIASEDHRMAMLSLAIDTVEDFQRLEKLSVMDGQKISFSALSTLLQNAS